MCSRHRPVPDPRSGIGIPEPFSEITSKKVRWRICGSFLPLYPVCIYISAKTPYSRPPRVRQQYLDEWNQLLMLSCCKFYLKTSWLYFNYYKFTVHILFMGTSIINHCYGCDSIAIISLSASFTVSTAATACMYQSICHCFTNIRWVIRVMVHPQNHE